MAKVFMMPTDLQFTVSDKGTVVYGAAGEQNIILNGNTTSDVSIDANIEAVTFSGNVADYKFQQVGTTLKIYNASDVLISSVGVQDDANGTNLVFADKSVAAIFATDTAGFHLKVDNVQVSSDVPSPLALVLPPNTYLNPDNGHYYQFVASAGENMGPNGQSWTYALNDAATRTLGGMQGYLATVTTQAEADFLYAHRDTNSTYNWIGLSDSQTEGTWKWVAGPEAGTVATYTNWAVEDGEPNDWDGTEDYASAIMNSTHLGRWFDYGNGGNSAYIAEYSPDYLIPL